MSDGRVEIDTSLNTKGVEGGLDKLSTIATKGAGAIVKGIGAGIGITTGAIATLVTQSTKAYAEFEQLTGGVETLFGKSADQLFAYAEQGYITSGLSANKYMEQATSFSASLLQSLGGDTQKTVEYSNRAIIDMSDNANKMGTNIESIQNAYQGFAKQNYTMLDNLKLGYGGTKEEAERLVHEASQMKDEMEKLGITVEDGNIDFANMVDAISVVQEHLGIAGTTTIEASTTIEGSTKMMQASWDNLVVGIADDNADFDRLLGNFVDSVGIMVQNILPRIEQAIKGVGELIKGLIPVIKQALPVVLGEIVPEFVALASELVITLIDGLLDIAPDLVTTLLDIMLKLVDACIDLLPKFVDVAFSIINAIMKGLTKKAPELLTKLSNVIVSASQNIQKQMPKFLENGIQLIRSVVNGLRQALPTFYAVMPEMVKTGIDLIIKNLDVLVPLLVLTIKEIIVAVFEVIKAEIISISKSFWGGIWQIINADINKIKNEVLPSMVAIGKSVIDSIINGILANIGRIKDVLTNKLSGLKIGNLFGNSSSAMLDVSNSNAFVMGGSFGGMTQIINVNQKISTPDELARAMRLEARYS